MKNLLQLLLIPFFCVSQIDYETEIQPIFDANCVSCHSNGATYTGGIELTSYDALMTGGYTTDNTNILYTLVDYISTGYMPAWGEEPLAESEVDLIIQWIAEGANPSDNWGNDCIDDPDGMVAEYGSSCSELAILGCDSDLSAFIPGIGFGISVYEICPESCGDCGDDIVGCTDPEACNYDDSIIPGGFDDGSCEYPGDECEGFDQQLQEVVYGYLEEDCECALPLSIDVFLKNKEIIKIVNVLGKESHINLKEQISIYIYDDGSIEKKYILE